MEKVVILVVCIMEMYIMFDVFKDIFVKRKRMDRRKVYLISLISCCVLFIAKIAESTYINIIFVPLIFWIYILLLFDAGYKKRIICFVSVWTIRIGCEFLYLILLYNLTNLRVENTFILLNKNVWQLMAINLFTYIVFHIVRYILGKTKNNITGKFFLIYLFLSMTALGSMITVIYAGSDVQGNFRQRYPALFFCIIIFCGNVLIYHILKQYTEGMYWNEEQKVLVMKQDAELNYLRQKMEQITKYKEWVHDSCHYLKMIGELALEGKNNEIYTIITELNGEMEEHEQILFSENVIINALLSEKALESKKKNVIFDAYVEPDINFGNIKDIDLISMTGNLLDNAIRAAAECIEDAVVKLRIFMQNEKNVCVIKIVNDYAGGIQKADTEFVTTKKEEGIHGIGIKSVKNVAEKYNGYLNCYIEESKFYAILVLAVT